MQNRPLSPEVRQELLRSLTQACVLWTEDLMKGYFDDPHDSSAQQLILEAYAAAVTTIAARTPSRSAILRTFLMELQDRINKDPS